MIANENIKSLTLSRIVAYAKTTVSSLEPQLHFCLFLLMTLQVLAVPSRK